MRCEVERDALEERLTWTVNVSVSVCFGQPETQGLEPFIPNPTLSTRRRQQQPPLLALPLVRFLI